MDERQVVPGCNGKPQMDRVVLMHYALWPEALPEADAATMDAHLAVCKACEAEHDAQVKFRDISRANTVSRTPDHLRERLRAILKKQRPKADSPDDPPVSC